MNCMKKKFRIVYFNPEVGRYEISKVYEGNKEFQQSTKEFYDISHNNKCSRIVPPSGGKVWSYLVEK